MVLRLDRSSLEVDCCRKGAHAKEVWVSVVRLPLHLWSPKTLKKIRDTCVALARLDERRMLGILTAVDDFSCFSINCVGEIALMEVAVGHSEQVNANGSCPGWVSRAWVSMANPSSSNPKTFTDSLGLPTVGFSARILAQLKKLWPQKESRVEDAFFLFHLFVMVGSQQPVWSTSIQEGHLEVFVFSWSFML
ncbi:hypothetical protein VitviT2T_023951 [Vitis vinifera]|uniref:DUF4283 domain-containing protein n=1 Tax=Vitis vinifera TaxID=29760 RepID=A0ABY9DE90_VITVI|nr:hypothetical protein VitviT2T_023951 [Vitis vinifera]